MTAVDLVGRERRLSDRRTCSHLKSVPEARGKSFDSTHVQSRVETLLVENQAAADEMIERLGHLIAALQTACNEARHAKSAGIAGRRAAHLAAGAVSGVST